MFNFPHGYLITLIFTPIFGTFPSIKITFSTGYVNPINIAAEEQFYGEIIARLNNGGVERSSTSVRGRGGRDTDGHSLPSAGSS